MPTRVPHNRPPTDDERIELCTTLSQCLQFKSKLEQKKRDLLELQAKANDDTEYLDRCNRRNTAIRSVAKQVIAPLEVLKLECSKGSVQFSERAGPLRAIATSQQVKRTLDEIQQKTDGLLALLESTDTLLEQFFHSCDIEQDSREAAAQAAISANKVAARVLDIGTSITMKRILLHPLRRLPTELLETLFTLVVEDERVCIKRSFVQEEPRIFTRNQNFISTSPRAHFVLASVCRTWRDIILDMPQLWMYLHLPYLVSPTSPLSLSLLRATRQPGRHRPQLELTVFNALFNASTQYLIENVHSTVHDVGGISRLNIVRPTATLNYIPSVPRLFVYQPVINKTKSAWSLFSAPVTVAAPSPLTPVVIDSQVLVNTVELSCVQCTPVLQDTIPYVKTFSLLLYGTAEIPDLGLLLLPFTELAALHLESEKDITILPIKDVCPVRVTSLTKLSISSNFFPSLGEALRQGWEIPHVTSLVILNVFGSFTHRSSTGLGSLFGTVKQLHFRAVSAGEAKALELRTFINLFCSLDALYLAGTAIPVISKAFPGARPKNISKLIIV